MIKCVKMTKLVSNALKMDWKVIKSCNLNGEAEAQHLKSNETN